MITDKDQVNDLFGSILNNEAQLLVVDQFEMEINRQNDYLVQYGLYRQPIIGDGNCLFRAISNALFWKSGSPP